MIFNENEANNIANKIMNDKEISISEKVKLLKELEKYTKEN